MRPNDPSTPPAHPERWVVRVVASLLLLAGVVLLLTGHWWSRPVIGFFEEIPGGPWLSIPVPYLPLIAVALGVRLLLRSAARVRA